MRLAVSNIAWSASDDDSVYQIMKGYAFSGVEIAPTRIIPESPYDHIGIAIEFSRAVHYAYEFVIPSMQSIWYGVSEKIFGSKAERLHLIAYTKKAIDFAEAIGCSNLVFGCPRNRAIPESADPAIAIPFFRELGNYAFEHHTTIGLEANPPIYNTNYINTTSEALQLIRSVDSKGFKLNLDIGTMIENSEDVSILKGSESLINHVHVSEPGLVPLQRRSLHKAVADLLHDSSYGGFVSIEVGRQDDLNVLETMMEYVSKTFA